MGKKSSKWKDVTTIKNYKDSKEVRVFGIARVSTDKQAKKVGESLDQQKEILKNWVQAKSSLHAPNEWKLIDIYVENEDQNGNRKGRSATKREGRKGLAKALELAKLKLVDAVVVTKLDRIARNVGDYIDISAEFNENDVALVCLDLDVDGSTPDGQMILRQHANLAQWQAERVSQYSMDTVQRHVEQGRPIGPPPIGYKITKDENGKTTFKPDSQYRKHIRFMEKTYLKLKSVTQVVKELHKKGYKSPKGKTYSKPIVSGILQNIRYTAQQMRDEKTYKGNWPPIRSIEDHEAIQKILAKNRLTNHGSNRSNKKYVYMAQSVLKCSKCGSSMISRPATGKGGKYYPYYMCMKAYKTHGIDCDEMNYLSAEAVDNAIIQILRNLRLDAKVVAQIVQGANKTTASTIHALEEDLKRIQQNLKEIRTKVSNLVEVLAEQGMKQVDAIKRKLETLNEEEKTLASEESRLKEEIQLERIQTGSAHEYIKGLQLFNDFYLMNQDNRERIQAIIPRLVNVVICNITDKQKGIGHLKIGLFGRPFENGQNAELWNNTLQKIADKCYNSKVLKEMESKLASKPQKKKRAKKTVACLKMSSSPSVVYSDRRYYDNPNGVFAQGKANDPSNFSRCLFKVEGSSPMGHIRRGFFIV